MKQCAFLTLADPTGYTIDDNLVFDPFLSFGWQVTTLPWNQTTRPWTDFDAVIVRSTWDYYHFTESFLKVLGSVTDSATPLFNSLGQIRWNIDKRYLFELAERGVDIVPTIIRSGFESDGLVALFEEIGSDKLVVKPTIGANAEGAFLLDRFSLDRDIKTVEARYRDTPYLAQPFVGSVQTEGEYSLMYFNGSFSHAILKKPATGDFRSQEEHGALIVEIQAEKQLLQTGEAVLAALSEVPLCARVDLVRANDTSRFWLMELELIEPAMYLRMDSLAPQRFANAFRQKMEG